MQKNVILAKQQDLKRRLENLDSEQYNNLLDFAKELLGEKTSSRAFSGFTDRCLW